MASTFQPVATPATLLLVVATAALWPERRERVPPSKPVPALQTEPDALPEAGHSRFMNGRGVESQNSLQGASAAAGDQPVE